jgi:hypothetical protein
LKKQRKLQLKRFGLRTKQAQREWAIHYVDKMHKKTHASLKTIKALVKKDKNLSNTRKSAIMAVRKEDVPCISCGMAKKYEEAHP